MPVISLRPSPGELAEIRRRARASGKNLSAYARAALLPENSTAPGRPRVVRDKATGSLVLKPPPGTPRLTLEKVRELLADFP